MFGWVFQSWMFGWFKNEQFLFVFTAVDGFEELLLEPSSCCFSVLTHKQQRALQRVPKNKKNWEKYPQIMMSFLISSFLCSKLYFKVIKVPKWKKNILVICICEQIQCQRIPPRCRFLKPVSHFLSKLLTWFYLTDWRRRSRSVLHLARFSQNQGTPWNNWGGLFLLIEVLWKGRGHINYMIVRNKKLVPQDLQLYGCFPNKV